MGINFIKVAVIYFFIGISLGMYMGISDSFQFTSAHAHINLLGWVSLAITGIVYYLFPAAGENLLAKMNFWLMFIGVPVLSFAMMLFGIGKAAVAGPLSGIGGTLILLGVLLFVINIMKNISTKVRVQ